MNTQSKLRRAAGTLFAIPLMCLSVPLAAARPQVEAANPPTVSAAPGTVVRWSTAGTETCGMGKQRWPALDGACYYPIDLLSKPGPVVVSRSAKGHRETGRITVEPYDYPTQTVDLGAIPQAEPTHDEMKRALREEAAVDKMFARKAGPARFTLPLEAPAKPLPEARDFGVKRVFNDTPAGQPHMGADYTINLGTPVRSVANGTVTIAEDQFFAGNAVYIDHGDGLVTMYFHLHKIEVKPGDVVKKGQTIGLVGSTGRATGAHLYFGVRWHNARINPQLLLEDVSKIPALKREDAGLATTAASAAGK